MRGCWWRGGRCDYAAGAPKKATSSQRNPLTGVVVDEVRVVVSHCGCSRLPIPLHMVTHLCFFAPLDAADPSRWRPARDARKPCPAPTRTLNSGAWARQSLQRTVCRPCFFSCRVLLLLTSSLHLLLRDCSAYRKASCTIHPSAALCGREVSRVHLPTSSLLSARAADASGTDPKATVMGAAAAHGCSVAAVPRTQGGDCFLRPAPSRETTSQSRGGRIWRVRLPVTSVCRQRRHDGANCRVFAAVAEILGRPGSSETRQVQRALLLFRSIALPMCGQREAASHKSMLTAATCCMQDARATFPRKPVLASPKHVLWYLMAGDTPGPESQSHWLQHGIKVWTEGAFVCLVSVEEVQTSMDRTLLLRIFLCMALNTCETNSTPQVRVS